MNKIKEVTDYIDKASSEQKQVLNTLRELIGKAIPEVAENFKWSRPVYATQKDFCYLQFNKKHVNLGFFEFDKIEDPNNLLEGTGKEMRHVKNSKMVLHSTHRFFIKMIKTGLEV